MERWIFHLFIKIVLFHSCSILIHFAWEWAICSKFDANGFFFLLELDLIWSIKNYVIAFIALCWSGGFWHLIENEKKIFENLEMKKLLPTSTRIFLVFFKKFLFNQTFNYFTSHFPLNHSAIFHTPKCWHSYDTKFDKSIFFSTIWQFLIELWSISIPFFSFSSFMKI